MKRGDAFEGSYLKTADLGGKEHLVTIREVAMEVVERDEGRETKKPVCYFAGKAKGIVLNLTRWDILEDAYGEDTDEWLGQPVVIYPSTTRYKGERVGCMAFRIPKPENGTEEPPTRIDDDVPF